MNRIVVLSCALAVAFMFSNYPAAAYDENNHNLMILSGGSDSCGKMTNDAEFTSDGAAVYSSFIEGYLTAVNLYTPGKLDFFSGTDRISRYKFVLKYCQENPLSTVFAGILKIVAASGAEKQDRKRR